MESREEEWDLVIKVKYGNTLRRFSAYVHGRSMDHSISKLRAKIISLFKFSPDADIILTYTDEDGDVVTIDDDDELLDAAVSQHLNPLRINVKLNICESSDQKSQRACWSPQTETGLLKLSSAVNEASKSVTEPVCGTFAEHLLEVEAASAASTLTDYAKFFSEFALSDVNLPSDGALIGSQGTSGPSANLIDVTINDNPKAIVDPVPATVLLGTISSGNPEHIAKENERVNMTDSSSVATPTVDLNLDPPIHQFASEFSSTDDLLSYNWTTNNREEPEKGGGDAPDGKSMSKAFSDLLADEAGDHSFRNYVASIPSFTPSNTVGVAEVSSEDISKQFRKTMLSSQFHDSRVDVHYKGASTPIVPLPRLPFLTSCSTTHNYLTTFHRGVRCDGCGMFPIIGPRFKSNVKDDYDLCSFCFSEMGNAADYTRIERAHQPPPRPRLFKEPYHPHSRYGFPSSCPFRRGMRPSRATPGSSRSELGSCFIKDVTVTDGTVMPTSAPFTKIWRMRNNGTIAWPFGTQLIWTGGEHLGTMGSAQQVIPNGACPVDEEIDIAVDFTSPSKPGSYISYWKLASCTGRAFGQLVWVQIQVENPQPSSAADAGNLHGDLNLNLPPESIGQNGLGIINVCVEPTGSACDKSSFINPESEPLVDAIQSGSVEPIMSDSLLGACDGHATELVASVSDPVVLPEPLSEAATSADLQQTVMASGENPMDWSLLLDLEEMGFKQMDLNMEILKLNEYNLERSIYDLCRLAEWVPLLAELKEMGFLDKELNRKLLIKNGGSVERVVLDLIAGETD